jgi:lipoate-protein ligase A
MKRRHLLYHGTLLYDFPLRLIGECLLAPPRAPEYRAARAHGDFVMNLPLEGSQLRQCVQAAFPCSETARDWPREMTARLVQERFTQASWTNEF